MNSAITEGQTGIAEMETAAGHADHIQSGAGEVDRSDRLRIVGFTPSPDDNARLKRTKAEWMRLLLWCVFFLALFGVHVTVEVIRYYKDPPADTPIERRVNQRIEQAIKARNK